MPEGAKVIFTGTSKPVRAGRPVTREENLGGVWTATSTKKASKTRKATWSLTAGKAGKRQFRLRVTAFHGAARIESATRTLTIADVTSPPAPGGVVATAGNGVVQLMWSPSADAATFEIRFWVEGTAVVTDVPTTDDATTADIAGLTNETSYRFAVRGRRRGG